MKNKISSNVVLYTGPDIPGLINEDKVGVIVEALHVDRMRRR